MTLGTCETVEVTTKIRSTTTGRRPGGLAYAEIILGSLVLAGGATLLAYAEGVSGEEWDTAPNGMTTVEETPDRWFAYLFGVLFTAAGSIGTLHGTGEALSTLGGRSTGRTPVTSRRVIRSSPCPYRSPLKKVWVELTLDTNRKQIGTIRSRDGWLIIRPGANSRIRDHLYSHPAPERAAFIIRNRNGEGEVRVELDPARLMLLLNEQEREVRRALQTQHAEEQAQRRAALIEEQKQKERLRARADKLLKGVNSASNKCRRLKASLQRSRRLSSEAGARGALEEILAQDKVQRDLKARLRAIQAVLSSAQRDPLLADHRDAITESTKECTP